MHPPATARQSARVAACLLGALALGAAAAPARAADTADAEIRVEKGEGIRISKIDDWVPAVTDSTGTITGLSYRWDYECVYTTTGSYRVTVESANGAGPLTVVSAAGDTMRYRIGAWYRRGANYPATVPTYGATPFTITNLSGSTDPNCADEPFGGSNLFFAAYVSQANFNPAPPGIYRDTVTLTVSPE